MFYLFLQKYVTNTIFNILLRFTRLGIFLYIKFSV